MAAVRALSICQSERAPLRRITAKETEKSCEKNEREQRQRENRRCDDSQISSHQIQDDNHSDDLRRSEDGADDATCQSTLPANRVSLSLRLEEQAVAARSPQRIAPPEFSGQLR
jgi:hypothetical protein